MADEKKPARSRAAPRKKATTAAAGKPATAAGTADKAGDVATVPGIPASAGPVARRLSPLDGHYAGGPGAMLTPLGFRRRISLRAGVGAFDAVGAALGFALPTRPKSSAGGEGIAALWLGPDEWLLLDDRAIPDEEGADGTISAALKAVPGISVVDISHRNVGIAIEGPAAEAIVAAGCPQDLRLRSFPVGAASRTVLSKAEIVLWRTGEARFEIECWRSFADYVWTFLEEAARAPAV
ncbi:sarcosine oxidase subunit gamma [Aurantimonas sp. HBX-1]|uniref:sarcosine oxidase subunit gamma n=1 Tax=Aurantimonas sp. HBX-1 TaxID=2906072 RepID=UPI001F15C93D|nr:sarcosine oxidase subunit gamma [Aurantimonas sp. HBX-1]UIJ72784.1 sarcosine oxidase subunit gamma [Aurantimonas sp. HBX-1]